MPFDQRGQKVTGHVFNIGTDSSSSLQRSELDQLLRNVQNAIDEVVAQTPGSLAITLKSLKLNVSVVLDSEADKVADAIYYLERAETLARDQADRTMIQKRFLQAISLLQQALAGK